MINVKKDVLDVLYFDFIRTYEGNKQNIDKKVEMSINDKINDFIKDWTSTNDEVVRSYKDKYGYSTLLDKKRKLILSIKEKEEELKQENENYSINKVSKLNALAFELHNLKEELTVVEASIISIDRKIKEGMEKYRSKYEYDSKINEMRSNKELTKKLNKKEYLMSLLESYKESFGEKIYNDFYELLMKKNPELEDIFNAKLVVDEPKVEEKQEEDIIDNKDEKKKDDFKIDIDDDSIKNSELDSFKCFFEGLVDKKINKEKITKTELDLLVSLSKTISKKDINPYTKEIKNLIEYHNNGLEDSIIEDTKNEIVKNEIEPNLTKAKNGNLIGYGFVSRLIDSAKLAYYRNKINNISKSLKEHDLDDDAKNRLKEQIRKYDEKYNESLLVYNPTLINARNKVEKLKYKLYRNEITSDDKNLDKAQTKFHKYMTRGLKNKAKLNSVTVIPILNQYVELLAKTNNLEDAKAKADNFLEECKDILSDEDYLAYLDEFNYIYNYRIITGNQIFEYKDDDIEVLSDYYSEDKNKQNYKKGYKYVR